MEPWTQHLGRPLMRTAILAGFLGILIILVNCPSPNSDAVTQILPDASGAVPNSSLISSANVGGETSLPPPFVPIASDKTQNMVVTIDASLVRYPINKGNFGGKILKELDAYSLYKNWQNLKALTPGFWIWAQASPGSNYRWDTHSPVAGGHEAAWRTFEVNFPGAYLMVEAPSAAGTEYWQATDIRHCAYVNKVAGASRAYLGYLFRDATGAAAGRNDACYTRFDFKVDADTPFTSPDGDPWCLAGVQSSVSRTNFKVYITQDLHIYVVVYSNTTANPATQTKLKDSAPFTRSQWHTVEVYYKPGVASSAAAYYLDGVCQDVVTGLDTSTSFNADAKNFMFGCLGGTNAAGKVYIDAVRMNGAYIGTDPGDPRNFIDAVTFDYSPITVDDFLYYAEKAGVTPVLQAALYPPNTGHDYMTPQFNADFVEYVNGAADADYAGKAKTLDFTHNTPSDNWANLRAARGHVDPYNVKYFTMGNEPYWSEEWPKDNPSLYANACYEHIVAMKAVDPTIKAGVFMYNGIDWNKIVLTTNKDVLDWVCIQHDYSYEQGVAVQNQIPRLLGISAARSLTTGRPYISGHADSRAAINQYLAGRNDRDTIITAQDEHGFNIIYGPGTGGDLGYGIYRLGYRLETIEQAGPDVWDGDFLLINDRKYTYGIIGSDSLTPSYWACRLFYDHFGSRYLNVPVSSPTYIISSYITGAPLYTTPYISAYASLDDTGAIMKIIVINRSTDTTTPVNFRLRNFATTATAARVFTVGGAGKKATDNNLSDPSNVTIHESQIPLSGTSFTFNAEPLSMNAIEICKSAPPQVSVAYAGNMANLSWNAVPGAASYVVQWGPSAANPTGGTAKYPGGQAVVPAGATGFHIQMDPGDTLYVAVRTHYPDGTETPLSNVLLVSLPTQDPWKPTNVTTQVVGTTLIVTWNPVQGAVSYKISYGTSPTALKKTVTSTTNSKYLYPGIKGKVYLTVTAVKPDGTSGPPSDVVSAIMP